MSDPISIYDLGNAGIGIMEAEVVRLQAMLAGTEAQRGSALLAMATYSGRAGMAEQESVRMRALCEAAVAWYLVHPVNIIAVSSEEVAEAVRRDSAQKEQALIAA